MPEIDTIKAMIRPLAIEYGLKRIYLFGSFAKGTANEDSDIDIAVISDDFEDIYDCMAVLMGMTWDIDARIEPHPIKVKDFEEGNPFVQEIIDTGIKVA